MKIQLILSYDFDDTSEYEEDGLNWEDYINSSKKSKQGIEERFFQSDVILDDFEIVGVRVGEKEIYFKD